MSDNPAGPQDWVKLPCGCMGHATDAGFVVDASAFTCPELHNQFDLVRGVPDIPVGLPQEKTHGGAPEQDCATPCGDLACVLGCKHFFAAEREAHGGAPENGRADADQEPCEFCGDGPCPNGCDEAEGPCALCGRDPATGFAKIGDDWHCHGDNDPDPTCYMRAQRSLGSLDLNEVIAAWPASRSDASETAGPAVPGGGQPQQGEKAPAAKSAALRAHIETLEVALRLVPARIGSGKSRRWIASEAFSSLYHLADAAAAGAPATGADSGGPTTTPAEHGETRRLLLEARAHFRAAFLATPVRDDTKDAHFELEHGHLTLSLTLSALEELVGALERAEQRAADRTENVKAANARSRILADRVIELELRAEHAEQERDEAYEDGYVGGKSAVRGVLRDVVEAKRTGGLFAAIDRAAAVLAGSPDTPPPELQPEMAAPGETSGARDREEKS